MIIDEIRARWAGRQWAPYGKQVVAAPGSIDCPSDYTSARILAQTGDPAISHVISQAPTDIDYLLKENERLTEELRKKRGHFTVGASFHANSTQSSRNSDAIAAEKE